MERAGTTYAEAHEVTTQAAWRRRFAVALAGLLFAAPVGAKAEEGGERIDAAAGRPSSAAPAEAGPAQDAVPQGRPRIVWRVENPFRFFGDPKDTEIHRQTYLALSPDERRHPVLAAERALSERHPEGWAATMVDKTCWSVSQNRHGCLEGGDYGYPESHAVVAEVQGIGDASVTCTWLTAPKGGSEPRGKAVSQPCAEPLRVNVPYPGSVELTVEVGGREVAAETVRVRDILVVGMGDSFGSGEGNPDVPVRFSRERAADYGNADLTGYPARTGAWKQVGDKDFIAENARWLDQACHRSLYSYQHRAALQLALEDPHRAVTYVGVACSGAEVTAGLFLRYKGNEWVPNPPELSQISAVAAAQCGPREAAMQDLPEAYHIGGRIPDLTGGLVLRKCAAEAARKIDLLLVSIGGNDIGFARLVANAVLEDKSILKSLGGWFGQVHGQAEASRALAGLDARYKALKRAVHNILHVPWSESDRVVLTAYPGLALLDDGRAVCPDGWAGMEVAPALKLSSQKAREGSTVADKLDALMARSAKAHGWSFVNAYRRAFLGRGICAGFTDNALSIADDLRLPRRTDDGWYPYNPADYPPYASRQRWFRTPNDAFLTGNFHVAGSVLQKALKLETFSWFQLVLAATYSGAFHPTAEGHAAMADAVVEKARSVLDRYGQGPREAALQR